MKLLHLYHKTYNTGDGITNVVYNLSSHQNQLSGVQSTSLAFSSDDKLKQKMEFGITSTYKLLLAIKNYSPDYIYIHGIFRIKIPLLITMLKLMKFKVILVPHCSLMKKTIHHKSTKKTLYLSVFSKLSFQHVDFIQYLNNEENNDSISISKKINTYILPNGVNENHSIIEKKFTEIKPFYLGRCDIHHKGLDFLILSLNNFYNEKKHNIKFQIYGADKKQLAELIKLTPNTNILINPPIFEKEKEKALEENNIFIMTSRYEGLPISVLEALSYGNICLLTEGTNMATIVKSNNCGFIIKNTEDISCILNEIIKMPKQRLLEMSNNAKELVAKNYNWHTIASTSIKKITN